MAQAQPSRQAADRKFRTFFRLACIDARERSDTATSEVAALAGVSQNTIDRFEKGETFPEENFDRYLAVYASFAKADPRDFLVTVGRWWKRSGRPPLTFKDEQRTIPKGKQERGPKITTKDLVEDITRVEQAPDEAEAQPSATHTKPAIGE